MNELIDKLRLDAGIARIDTRSSEDMPYLVVINKEGNTIDPLFGLEKFAELIVKECLDIMTKEEYNTTMLTCYPMSSGAINDAKWKIKEHFGVK